MSIGTSDGKFPDTFPSGQFPETFRKVSGNFNEWKLSHEFPRHFLSSWCCLLKLSQYFSLVFVSGKRVSKFPERSKSENFPEYFKSEIALCTHKNVLCTSAFELD